MSLYTPPPLRFGSRRFDTNDITNNNHNNNHNHSNSFDDDDDGLIEFTDRYNYDSDYENGRYSPGMVNQYIGGFQNEYEYKDDDDGDEDDEDEEYTGKEDNIARWVLDAFLGTKSVGDADKKNVDEIQDVKERGGGNNVQGSKRVRNTLAGFFTGSTDKGSDIKRHDTSVFSPDGLYQNEQKTDDVTNTFQHRKKNVAFDNDTLEFKKIPGTNDKNSRSNSNKYQNGYQDRYVNYPEEPTGVPGGFLDSIRTKISGYDSRKSGLKQESLKHDSLKHDSLKHDSLKHDSLKRESLDKNDTKNILLKEIDANNKKLENILKIKETQEYVHKTEDLEYKKKYLLLKKEYVHELKKCKEFNEMVLHMLDQLQTENDLLKHQLYNSR